MADDGDVDSAVAATIFISALNDKIVHRPLTNSDAAFQSRDCKFLALNRTMF